MLENHPASMQVCVPILAKTTPPPSSRVCPCPSGHVRRGSTTTRPAATSPVHWYSVLPSMRDSENTSCNNWQPCPTSASLERSARGFLVV